MASNGNILSKIFKTKNKQKTGFMDVLSMIGYEPNFSKFGEEILYSNIYYSALKLKSRFFKKLDPRHVREANGKTEVIIDSDIAKVLRRPNYYQTTSDFLAQAYFMREKDKTCYIFVDAIKTTKGKQVEGLYVLIPSNKPDLVQYQDGKVKWEFDFEGYSSKVVFDYGEIIVWKTDIEDNQYIGGGKFGRGAEKDLLNSLEAYHTISETTAESAKLGCMFDGYLKVNAYAADNDKAQKMRDAFVEDIRTNKAKIPVLDNGAEYVELKRQLKMVDSATMKEIKENILISTGVSLEMLLGKITPQDKEALYENFIEEAAISLGQAMGMILFTPEQDSRGNRIIIYPHKVQLMATSEIVSIIQNTISAGVFMIDEYRDMLGYAPLPNGEGEQRPRGFNNLDGTTTQEEEGGES